jgi:hypothetical protein
MRWLLGAVLVAGFAACGEAHPAAPNAPSDAGNAGALDSGALDSGALDDADPSPQSACAFMAEQHCDWFERCLPQNSRAGYEDVATCVENTALRCVADLTVVGTNHTPSRARACGHALATLSCDAYPALDLWPESCTAPPGKLPDGAKCLWSAQCKGGDCSSRGYFCGVCVSHAPVGAHCIADQDCVSSLCENSVCAPAPRPGEPCNQSRRQCAGNAICDAPDPDATGVCWAALPRGSACDPSVLGGRCDSFRNDFCNVETRICQAGPIWSKPIGSSCSTNDCGPTGCTAVAYCDSGVCTALSREGEPCGKGGCLMPAACVRGTCSLPSEPMCD